MDYHMVLNPGNATRNIEIICHPDKSKHIGMVKSTLLT
jgi:hypothetical protein